MRKTLNIGIDADGVIFNLFKYQIEKGLKHFKVPADQINIEKYDIKDIFNCTYLERQAFWLKYIYDYCMHSELVDGAIEVIKKLRDEGHKLYNITSRVYVTDNGILGTIFRKMLEKRYEKEGIVFDGIDYCSEKDSARDKMLACHKRQIDIMLEDKIDNLESISKIAKVLCFDAPYNQGIEGENIIRVKNFWDSYDYIKNYVEEYNKEVGDKQYVVDGRLKRVKDESKLSELELKDYYKQRKEHYMNMPYDKEYQEKQEKNYKIAHRIIIPTLKHYYNPKIINKELIPYQNGVIFVSNHLGSLDQFPILHAIGRRPVHFLVASTLLELKRGWLYKRVGSIFVDRESVRSRYESLEELTRIVANNGNIFIFPEGTRNRNPNKYMLNFQLGPVTIAQITGAPIVPFATNGHFNFRSKDLLVRVGEPMVVRPGEDLVKANEKLEEIVSTMIWENMEDERRLANGEKIDYSPYRNKETEDKILIK